MALPQGINFRDSLAYVTDGANESYEGQGGLTVNLPTYPRTTAQGNNVGWEGSGQLDARDRNSAIPRLAGANAVHAGETKDFRIDLPAAGNYKVRLAAGDATYTANTKNELFDTTTSLGVLCSGNTGASNSFKDAANTILTAANWVTSNALVSVTMATTIMRVRMGDGSLVCEMAHFYVEAGAAAAPPKVSYINFPKTKLRQPITAGRVG